MPLIGEGLELDAYPSRYCGRVRIGGHRDEQVHSLFDSVIEHLMLVGPWRKYTVERESVPLRPCHQLRRAHMNSLEVLIELDDDISSFPLLYRVRRTKPSLCVSEECASSVVMPKATYRQTTLMFVEDIVSLAQSVVCKRRKESPCSLRPVKGA